MTDRPDPDITALTALRVWKYREGEVVALMIHLGDRLGLYRTMWGAGPMTAADLAQRTGLAERWLSEWLRGQAAAELIASDDGRTFELKPEQAAVLADEGSSRFFAAGAFGPPLDPGFVDALAEAFRTGRGLPYDALGSAGAHRTERTLGPWTRQALVPELLARLNGVVERLRSGARVADVGCGTGLALRVLGSAFPSSTFVGIDPSRHAIEAGRTVIAGEGLTNVELVESPGESIDEHGPFDLVLSFDCLHDMPRPDRVASEIGRTLVHDGTWLVKEIRSTGDFAQDRKNPVLAMMYGSSIITCLSCATSEPDGLGLGTLGLPPTRLEELAAEAGFGSVTVHDIGDPANLYYEIRR